MAPDVATVERLLEQLREVSLRAARSDLEELGAYAAQHGGPDAGALQNWDVPFWAQRLREEP